jgi:hypothetical protein
MNAKVAQLWARGCATAKTLSYDHISLFPPLANPPPSGDIPETKGAFTAETDPIPSHRPTHSSKMILKSSLVTQARIPNPIPAARAGGESLLYHFWEC